MNYVGVLRKNTNKKNYDFNDLLEELKGKNLSRLTPKRQNMNSKKIIYNFLKDEINKINDTDEFL